MKIPSYVGIGLVIGFAIGWHSALKQHSIRRQQTIENIRQMELGSKIYQLAYSNNPSALHELFTNQASGEIGKGR